MQKESGEKTNSTLYQANHVDINVSLIPSHLRNDLAADTLRAVQDFLRHPGGREVLDKKAAEINLRINLKDRF